MIKIEGSHSLNPQKKTMFFMNHRSWGDFFTHDVLSEGSSSFLSRKMVGVIFPVLYLYAQISRGIWFFNRGNSGRNEQERLQFREKLYNWIDSMWSKAYKPSLIVYPEGHRMFNSSKCGKLKDGMINYAYSRQIPIQIIISFGTEQIINEKQIQVNFKNNDIVYFIDEVIDPKMFQTQEEFFTFVKKQFESNFDKTYIKYLEQKKLTQ